MKRTLTIFGTLVPALALAACGGTTNTSTTDTTVVDNGMAADPTMNMADNSMMAPPTAASGQQFADMAAASDAYEIAAGNLAKTKATTQGLKDFGAMMVKDHTDSTAKLKAAGKKASPAITPNPVMTDEQNANLATLKSATGADFDTAYKSQQIAAHQKALALMQGYGANGDVNELKVFAGTTAPVVDKHLAEIQGM